MPKYAHGFFEGAGQKDRTIVYNLLFIAEKVEGSTQCLCQLRIFKRRYSQYYLTPFASKSRIACMRVWFYKIFLAHPFTPLLFTYSLQASLFWIFFFTRLPFLSYFSFFLPSFLSFLYTNTVLWTMDMTSQWCMIYFSSSFFFHMLLVFVCKSWKTSVVRIGDGRQSLRIDHRQGKRKAIFNHHCYE